ncbi:hypothetical protein KKA95_04100, partial [Patescibacteria group bacterium]|nr:hypothetical protein [Patescibacteria group bacterium]
MGYKTPIVGPIVEPFHVEPIVVESDHMTNLEKFIYNQGWSMYGIVSFEEIQKSLKKHKKIFEEWLKKGYEADM